MHPYFYFVYISTFASYIFWPLIYFIYVVPWILFVDICPYPFSIFWVITNAHTDTSLQHLTESHVESNIITRYLRRYIYYIYYIYYCCPEVWYNSNIFYPCSPAPIDYNNIAVDIILYYNIIIIRRVAYHPDRVIIIF